MDGKIVGVRLLAAFGVPALLLVVNAAIAAPAADSRTLVNAAEVLKETDAAPAPGAAPTVPNANQLLADIADYRTRSSTMEPKLAATAWFALYERAHALPATQFGGDVSALDPDAAGPVSVRSVLRSLPPPKAWPALRDEARSRAKRAPEDPRVLAGRLMTELLLRDRAAAELTLKQIETLAADLAPDERSELLAPVGEIRSTLARLYGTPDEIAATFMASLKSNGHDDSLYAQKEIPDLVGLVGEARAAVLMKEVVTSRWRVEVKSGDATRALAQRVALEQIDALRTPQWSLVDSIEGADLYEALQRRFDTKPATVKGAESEPAAPVDFDYRRSTADGYYFVAMLLKGNQAAAEAALARLSQGESFSLSKQTIAALQRSGKPEALYLFLNEVLKKRPELQVWDLYVEQAAYAGHSTEALALIDTLLARKGLPDYVQAELRRHRTNALLARDDIEPATGLMLAVLKPAPSLTERDLEQRVDVAIRMVGLGRVLSRTDLVNAGLAFLRRALELPAAESDEPSSWRDQALRSAFAEQRKLGRLADAQALAVQEVRRQSGQPNQYQRFGIEMVAPGQQFAMAELAGLYTAAGRHADTVSLLNESVRWGSRDLVTLLAVRDSLDVPVVLSAARSLAATGNNAAALSMVKALLQILPGYDPAYELLISIDPEATRTLENLYARDSFQERPLIWQAVVLMKQGKLDEAQVLVTRAVAIDPSDGEEGPDDRMRAYALLADILAAKGDAKTAADYRGAVAAIRISERSDELHKLGLYQRAFAGYREALTHFEDAYCIQSRLAVQLSQQGRRSEALDHYRRAYELMPASFGRVESHCFGCESVFQGTEQQGIAEAVFTGIVAKSPEKPQAHYLLGYLREEQGQYAAALQPYRDAVSLDPDYLNAWKKLYELGAHTYIEPSELDIARMRLLALDPTQLHVTYSLNELGDPAVLWSGVEKASALQTPRPASIYPLRRSTQFYDETLAKLPEEIRAQMTGYQAAVRTMQSGQRVSTARAAVARHVLIAPAGQLMGATPWSHDY